MNSKKICDFFIIAVAFHNTCSIIGSNETSYVKG